ncbi:MAG: pseudouridine synthase [Monoglobales bacterium]
MNELMRLQKFIAGAGICSRRKAEELIKKGKVKVDGEVVTELGTKIDPDTQSVEVEGRLVCEAGKKYYIMLNKPAGYVTTTADAHAEKTVMDLVTDIKARIYPVGRLDADTEGLLLMTNDGDFANAVIHPSKKHEKVYIAEVKGLPMLETLRILKQGVDTGEYITKPARVELLKGNSKTSTLKIGITEGKKRQVRIMCETVGHPVIALKRVEIGPLSLGNLPKGKWRHLRKEEIDRICSK